MRYTFHHTAVTQEHVSVVVNNIVINLLIETIEMALFIELVSE